MAPDSRSATLPESPRQERPNGAEGEFVSAFLSRIDSRQLDASLAQVQRLAGIGTLAAGAAHELTNPLGSITATSANLLDQLADGSIDRDNLIRSITQIEQNAYRAARLVELIGNYAHGYLGPDDNESGIAITSPAAVVRDALTLVEYQFQDAARVQVEVFLESSPATIFCNHNSLTQVLVNLLTNARDAMQSGGVVRVRFWTPNLESGHLSEATLLPVVMSQAGGLPPDLFAFSVADSGTGIPMSILDRIFDPFFTTKANGVGIGLGLFIARRIVEQHKGCIWAENKPGGGATFTVIMPRRP